MKKLIIPILLSLSSCTTPGSLFQTTESKIEHARVATAELFKNQKDDDVKKINKPALSETPITDEFSSPGNYENYKKELCFKIKNSECAKKYSTTAFARMSEKYNEADPNQVILKCDAYPVECKNTGFIERQFIQLHTSSIREKQIRENEAWNKERLRVAEANAEAEKRRESEAWQGLANAFQQQEANRLRQQEINQQNQPQIIQNNTIRTNCQTYGNSTSCTSH